MATDAPHITPIELGLDPQDAWKPIDAAAWTPDAIKHFLRRSGWAALPEQVESASQKGLESTLQKHFPQTGTLMPEPVLTTYLAQDSVELQRKARQEPDPDAKREYQRQLRERNNSALDDQAIRWLMFASDPSHSAVEKWVLFLSDVYVVAIEKVRNSSFIFTHFDAIRKNCLGAAPALSKSMLRSPALVTYLDLQQNKPQAPNENFARELFELFVLGEGNYSEDDIKEAARALTGYRINGERVQFQSKQHDKSPKTIFGQTSDYDGEGLIDLAYTQKAASTFLPREMVRYYLSEIPLDPAYIDALGEYWAGTRHDLQALTHRFFSSRIFYHPQFRGALIKSPVHFYLGLLQDLQLDVAPFPRKTLSPLRNMGQQLFNPPNVRGWVGGRTWISSSTLSARRQLVQYLFQKLREDQLNADELLDYAAAVSEKRDHFFVRDERLKSLANQDDNQVVTRFVDYFLPLGVDNGFRQTLRDYLNTSGGNRFQLIRDISITLLQTPEYQLC